MFDLSVRLPRLWTDICHREFAKAADADGDRLERQLAIQNGSHLSTTAESDGWFEAEDDIGQFDSSFERRSAGDRGIREGEVLAKKNRGTGLSCDRSTMTPSLVRAEKYADRSPMGERPTNRSRSRLLAHCAGR